MTKKRSRAQIGSLVIVAALVVFAWITTLRSPIPVYERADRGEEALGGGGRRSADRASFEGEVVGVIDGDTIDVMRDGKAERVRLAEIDCPERRQPFGMKAKQRASELVFGKRVRVEVRNRDRYGRVVARVFLPDGRSLNEALVRDGYAWWYRQYSDNARLGRLEEKARDARAGLWRDAEPVPPWEFRQKRRK